MLLYNNSFGYGCTSFYPLLKESLKDKPQYAAVSKQS